MNELKKALVNSYTAEGNARDSGPIAPWKELERSTFRSLLLRENRHRLLEVGAGTGRDSLFFQQGGLDVTAIDLTPSMVEMCRAKGIRTYVMDADHLDCPPASFDAAFSMNSLVHVPKRDLAKVLGEIARVLTRDGLLYCCVWGGTDHEGIWEDDDHDPKRFFSFYEDRTAPSAFGQEFAVESFTTLNVGLDRHPQMMYLRRRPGR